MFGFIEPEINAIKCRLFSNLERYRSCYFQVAQIGRVAGACLCMPVLPRVTSAAPRGSAKLISLSQQRPTLSLNSGSCRKTMVSVDGLYRSYITI